MKLHTATHKGPIRVGHFEFHACPKCEEMLVSPQYSEYLGNGRVQHHWSCDDCGHEFRTASPVSVR